MGCLHNTCSLSAMNNSAEIDVQTVNVSAINLGKIHTFYKFFFHGTLVDQLGSRREITMNINISHLNELAAYVCFFLMYIL